MDFFSYKKVNKLKKTALTFSRKISNHLTCILVIILILVILIINISYGLNMKKQVVDAQKVEANYVSNILIQTFNTLVDCTNNVGTSLYYSFMDYHMEYYYMNADANNEIRIILEDCSTFYKNVDCLNILLSNGDFYTKENNGILRISRDNMDIVSELDGLEITTKGKWLLTSSISSLQTKDYISFVKPIHNVSYNKENGYIIMQISKDKILDIYLNQTIENQENYYLISREGEVISQYESFEIVDIEDISNNNYISTRKNIINDITFYSIINMNNFYMELYQFTLFTWVLCAILIIILRLMILYYSNQIAKPFEEIANHMSKDCQVLPRKINLQISDKYSVSESDVLLKSFNNMIEVMDSLFEEIQKETIKRQKLEISLLFEQIKPHFLYNTLDSIYCLNKLNRIEEASQLTKTLAEFYRETLSQGDEWVSIKKELEIADGYLKIQKVRYCEQLEYELIVVDEIYDYLIPKLTLQPLIENAIYHGLKSKREGGKIIIKAYQDENDIYIKIIDNGNGFSTEKFQNIITCKEDGEHGFGLKSVHDRVKLYYKNDSTIFLEPCEVGTVMVIYIQNVVKNI